MALAMLVVVLAATTLWALESGGVAVIETRTRDGAVRSTHVWYSEQGGELWLEAGSPENGWFRDVQRSPALTFEADGASGRYLARPVAGRAAHLRVRTLMREKYAFRDRWVGLIADTSHSIAVQLLPSE